MARVTGPLMSFSASGTIGDAITFATWKGIEYCRQWFVPGNPQTAKQTNIRTAMSLCVAYWQVQSDPSKDGWNAFASGTKMSGFNQFVRRALIQYLIQIGIDVTPVSVAIDAVPPPGETWTWT